MKKVHRKRIKALEQEVALLGNFIEELFEDSDENLELIAALVRKVSDEDPTVVSLANRIATVELWTRQFQELVSYELWPRMSPPRTGS